MKKIGKLHVLTDTVFQGRFSHVELAQMAVAGGADTVQFRQKEGSTRELIELAIAMKEVCAGVPLVVNDRVDVALAAEADGVHLGQNDFPIAKARELLGNDCIIGGTAKTLEQAQQCIANGADYLGYGPIYATGSKTDAGVVKGVNGLHDFVNAVDIPIIAIGGIELETADDVMRAGAYGIAVISAVCSQDDPTEATRALVASM